MQLADRIDAPSKGSRAGDFRKNLHGAISTLEGLNHDTEQYFLTIGEKLGGFIHAVNMISSDLATLENSISGEQGLHASHALTRALDRAVEMGSHSAAGNDILGDLHRETDTLKRTLNRFESTVRTFRMLGILTRIETARLGSAGSEFGTLADDVKSLTATVHARVANALDSVGLLIAPIENARASAKDLPTVISNLAASLSSFRDIQSRVHSSTVRLGKQYAAILKGFNQLIVAIQFHDITRQQIEHVIDMLRRVDAESPGSAGAPAGVDPKAAAILALQSSQLADAAGKFTTSVESIGHSLDEVATLVVHMVAESRTLSGISADDKDSFFLKMEKGCTTVLASLGVCVAAENSNRAATSELVETIGRMRSPIEEIQAIEVQMRRMGMNARIQAARTGEEGNVLGVLATGIQQLALDSSQRSESLISMLGAMNKAALGLSKEDTPAEGGEVGYLEEMRAAVTQMHSASEQSFALINQIVTCGARLRENLAATRESFSVGALFADAVGRTQAILKEAGASDQSGLVGDYSSALRLGLANYGGHYTMQAERDVHDSITKAMARPARIAARAKPVAPPPREDAELGDNVEFF